LCFCGSGKRFKHCHGAVTIDLPHEPIENWHLVPQTVRDAFINKQQERAEHHSKYGLHQPPAHAGVTGDRVIKRGDELLHWAGKGSFINFLEEDLLFRVGDALEKHTDHPLREWLDELRRQGRDRKAINPKAGLLSTVATMNFFTVAYDLYVVSDNSTLRDRLLKSLRVPAQFHGARYELMIAACLLRGGFDVQFTDETDDTTKHTDAFVRHLRTGTEYDVEMKAKGRSGVLGKPGVKIEPSEMNGNVSRQIRRALTKPAERERLIFIDMNLPPKPEHDGPFEVWWVHDAVQSLKMVREQPGKISSELSAFVIFSNSPSNFMPLGEVYEGLETAFGAYNKPEFDKDFRVLGERAPEIADLFDAFRLHSEFPDQF